MLREATLALSHLDAEALEALERRASALRDSLAGRGVLKADAPEVSELRAQHSVFSDVVTVMSKDLAMLRRTCVSKQGRAGNRAEAGVRWVR